jgi:proton-coupled amino acid transporter
MLKTSPYGTLKRYSSSGMGRSLSSRSVAAMLSENGESYAASVKSIDIDNPDPEVVKVVGRHLVTDSSRSNSYDNGPVDDVDNKFASLRLQGGDITRQLYNWQREHEEAESSTKRNRSRSFDVPKSPSNEPETDMKSIRAPGGFRRNFIVNKNGGNVDIENLDYKRPPFLTRNFIEFLTIYGHFAGEELEEEDEDSEEEGVEREIGEPDEQTALLSGLPGKKSHHPPQGNATATKAVMLLLKSFVGTGVVFLPRAFYNGGILFSTLVLIFVSILSYWCFILLIRSKTVVGVASFGDIGGRLYGPWMRQLILTSIVISQIGFAAAYIVFTSENLRAFILACTNGKTVMSIESLILLQIIIFLPLSMIRDIAKLSGTALIADFFIMLGLVYLYFWGTRTLIVDGVADIKLFNSQSFSLFVGTAIFTYEGIGLILPIQESMKKPRQFMPVLGGVMVGITIIFVSMGALSYAAYGSKVETVVILNLPQDSRIVNSIQLLYAIAIVLSTPLQLFPAIRIMENWLFVRSGKYSKKIKWQKNMFRFGFVLFTALVAYGGADDLDKFVSITGSFACIPLVYVYPPMLHLKSASKTLFSKSCDVILILFGIWAMAYTTMLTARSWVNG